MGMMVYIPCYGIFLIMGKCRIYLINGSVSIMVPGCSTWRFMGLSK